MGKILIVDDEKLVRDVLRGNLAQSGFVPAEASDGMEAIRLFNIEKPDAVLLDIRMPGMDGITTLQKLKEISPEVPVIIITAHGDIPSAVNAIKLGAYDFISKPPDFEMLVLILKRAVEKVELERRLQKLDASIGTSLEWTLGKSPAMGPVIKQISQVAGSDFSLIIQGETGTGKSLVARTIHNLSNRAGSLLVTVDIGAIPETLVESELFGHEKGAFTGADKKKKGFFEGAAGGTLFIDELQNMSQFVQAKLLRAVEEKKIYPLGSTRPELINVRIISATNADIREAVREKKFREDLFYRLGEFIISIPPLRERVEDITFLSQKFLTETADELDKPVRALSEESLALLKDYSWPGNVRELKNVIRRAVLVSQGEVILPEHIVFLIKDKSAGMSEERTAVKGLPLSLLDIEKMAIKQALDLTNGNKTKAAAILQIDYSTLLRKIKQYSISL